MAETGPKPMNLIVGRTSGGVNLPILVDADGKIEVVASVSAGDTVLVDGVDSGIKATVKDYTNSNPLAVVTVDTNGDPVSAGSDATAANQVLEIAELEELTAQQLDYDTGAGTASQVIFGLSLPASGGPVAGGTATNPVRTDPTGTTPQPVSGTVAVSAVVPGVAATSLGKAEDAAHTTGDTGVMALVVRQDSQVDFGADGDYVPMSVDENGGVRVSIVAGAGSGGTASADGTAFVADTTSGTPAMGVYESSPTALTDGDLGVAGLTVNRELKTSAVVTASALPTGAATLAEQQLQSANLSQIDDWTFNTSILLADVISGNEVQVDVLTSALPTGASTLAEQQTQTTALSAIQTAVQIMDDWDESDRAKVNPIVGQAGVQGGAGGVSATTQRVAIATDANAVTAVGTIADDATTPGAPVMVGGMAKSPDGTDPGSVSAENDVARAITDLNRRVFVNHNHPRTLRKHLDGSSAYTDEAIVADPGDGFQTVITNIIGSTGAATALNFFLEEGSTKIFGPIYLEAVAGRGFCSGPIYLPVTASTAVTLTSSASIAQSFDIEYFIQAV